MGFNPNMAVTAAPADTNLPPNEAPRASEFVADLKTLMSQTDKDLRMFFCGLYQAVLQSSPTYGLRTFKTIDDWHAFVDAEVEHYARRVLAKSTI